MACKTNIANQIDTLINQGVSMFANLSKDEANKKAKLYNKQHFGGYNLVYFIDNQDIREGIIEPKSNNEAREHLIEIIYQRDLRNEQRQSELNNEAQWNGIDNKEYLFNRNSIQPLGDNYQEFINYKEALLENINNQIIRYRTQLKNATLNSNINILDINNQIKSLEKEISIINRQLESLKQDESKYMFHAIMEDLELMTKAVESENLIDIQKTNEKLDFLDEFISGNNKAYKGEPLSMYDNENFDTITGKVKKLQDQLNDKIIQISQDYIENDSAVKQLIENNEDLDTSTLFQAQKDLNWFETWTLGVTADRSNNSIIPQALYRLMRKTLFKKQSSVEKWNKELKQLVENNSDLENPEFIYEKDEHGNKTGFIVNLFTPQYYKALKSYQYLLSQFKKDMTQDNYNEVINELLKNNNVIDFTKLRVVRDIYSINYADHFNHSEETYDQYEQSLKDGLGPQYEEIINQILQKLALFEEKKQDILADNGKYAERDLASQDIWRFNKIIKSNNKTQQVFYTYENNEYGVLFKDFNNLTILPKKHTYKDVEVSPGYYQQEKVETGFYNKEFENIAQNENKLAYWKLIKSISEYISSTYDENNMGRLSYPKVQIEYAERMQKLIKDKNFGPIISGNLREYKSWFYERGRFSEDKNTVKKNHLDNFNNEVRELARTYEIQGSSKEQAVIEARNVILKNYTSDFNSSIIGVAMEAALHDARLEVQPMAQAYIKYFKSIGPDRVNAINKLEHFYEKIILNVNSHYRKSDKIEGKNLSDNTLMSRFLELLKNVPYLKTKINEKSLYFLSDAEKEIFKELQNIQEDGTTDNKFTFVIDDMMYIQSDSGNTFSIDLTDTSDSKDKRVTISKATYDENFKIYIDNKVADLGLDLNLAGLINGILKTTIFKGLALNPISGIFNRIEGKHSSMIMDATGEYWTTGNIDIANNLMNFANITRLSNNRLSPLSQNKKYNLQIFDTLLKQFNILQDRKNELQRSAEESKFDRELTNPFIWAVENPEYKNQGSIIMAILMDTNIQDNQGNTFPILDKETGNFTIYNLVDGKLELKDEFRTEENVKNYEDFQGSQSEDLIIRMTDAVSRSQGNYDAMDIMMAKKGIWGRVATLFMSWFPEHLNQRFGVSGEDNYNLATGKKRKHGRFIEAYRSNKLNTIMGAVTGLTVSYGLGGPLLATAGLGGLSMMVYRKFTNKIVDDNAIKRDIHYAKELAEFVKSTLIESLNYPGRMLNIGNKFKIPNNSFGKTNMTEDEIASMRALTRELAVVLTWLMVKLLIGGLTYDDDDDKDSPARLRHNFIQNQLSRTINTLTIYSNPQELVSDSSRFAALQTVSTASKLLLAIWSEKQREDFGKNALKLSPIPRILTKGMDGYYPWEDKYNYDSFSNMDLPSPLKWTTELHKDLSTNNEHSARKEYLSVMKEYRNELKVELMSKHKGKKKPMKKEIDKLIRKKIGVKKKNQTYVSRLEEVKQKLGK